MIQMEVKEIVFGLLSILGLILAWIWNSRIKQQDDSLAELKSDMKEGFNRINETLKATDARSTNIEKENTEIVSNYKDRFDGANKSIFDTRITILEAIAELKQEINDKFVTKEFCMKSHESTTKVMQTMQKIFVVDDK